MNLMDLFKNKKSLQEELNKLYKESDEIADKIFKLEEQINLVSKINNVIDNILINEQEYKTSYGIEYTITSFNTLGGWMYDAVVYPDAHTSENGIGKTWHIRIQEYTKGFAHFFGGNALLLNLPYEEARKLAIRYVTTGKLPNDPEV